MTAYSIHPLGSLVCVKDQQHEEEHDAWQGEEVLDDDSDCPEDEQEGIELLEIPEETNMDVQGPTTTKNDKASDMEIDLAEAPKEPTEEIHERKVG